MKYKKGQKVNIRRDINFHDELKKILEKIDYILTIKEVHIAKEGCYSYIMEEIKGWGDECLSDYIIDEYTPDPITTRFEILDL